MYICIEITNSEHLHRYINYLSRTGIESANSDNDFLVTASAGLSKLLELRRGLGNTRVMILNTRLVN